MITQTEFHSLRLSQLSLDRAERAPENARHNLVFAVGRKRLEAMDAIEQDQIYHSFLAEELREMSKGTDHWFDASYHTANDDGISMWYAGERLARLELAVATTTVPGPMAGLLSIGKQPNPARQKAHFDSLLRYGWPLAAGSLWQDALPILLSDFDEVLVQRSFNGYQTTRGLCHGLYYAVTFFNGELCDIAIVDPELVRENMIIYLDSIIEDPENQELEGADGNEGYSYLAQQRVRRQEVAEADLLTLQGIMQFFYELPKETMVDYANPPLTCFQEPPPEPVDNRPEWMKSLSPEDELEMRELMFNTDLQVMDQFLAGMERVQSVAELRSLRDELQSNPKNKELISQGRREMAGLLGPERGKLSATGVEIRVHRTLRESFRLEKGTRLTGEESLRGTFDATDDDLHLLRVALGARLDINLHSADLAAINTVAELVAKVLELYQSPEAQPREDCPISVMELLNRQLMDSLDGFNEGIDLAVGRLKSQFDEDSAAFVLKSQA